MILSMCLPGRLGQSLHCGCGCAIVDLTLILDHQLELLGHSTLFILPYSIKNVISFQNLGVYCFSFEAVWMSMQVFDLSDVPGGILAEPRWENRQIGMDEKSKLSEIMCLWRFKTSNTPAAAEPEKQKYTKKSHVMASPKLDNKRLILFLVWWVLISTATFRCSGRKQHENMDPSCLLSALQAGYGGVMVWAWFRSHSQVADHENLELDLWVCEVNVWNSSIAKTTTI